LTYSNIISSDSGLASYEFADLNKSQEMMNPPKALLSKIK